MIRLPARPATFSFEPTRTALVVIDMQRDFLEPGGFGAALGNDVTLLQAIVPAVASLLALAREQGMLVIHAVLTPLRRHHPYSVEVGKRAGQVRQAAQTLDGNALQHNAQIVELVDLIEVQWLDRPAPAKTHFQIALAPQAIERVTHRRA